jgi:hypothetical protein
MIKASVSCSGHRPPRYQLPASIIPSVISPHRSLHLLRDGFGRQVVVQAQVRLRSASQSFRIEQDNLKLVVCRAVVQISPKRESELLKCFDCAAW